MGSERIAEKRAKLLTRRVTFIITYLRHRVEVWPQFVVRIKELEARQRAVTDAQHCVDASAAEGDETCCSADDDVNNAEKRPVGA